MALGDGLASLIPSQKPEQEPEKNLSEVRRAESIAHKTHVDDNQDTLVIFQIEIEKITPNPYQPRHMYQDEGLEGLAQSIREFGILQPLIASKIEEEISEGTRVTYQLISGERRLRAAKRAGLERVPVIIRNVAADRDKLSIALIENIQREDLNPIEVARAYARLQDEFQLTQREIASRIGKSRETVANTLRLLNLPTHIQEAVTSRTITESQARTLLAIENLAEQEQKFQHILHGRKKPRTARSVQKQKAARTREDVFWEQQLEERLETPVRIQRKGEEGKITISFDSHERWQSLLNKLLDEESIG